MCLDLCRRNSHSILMLASRNVLYESMLYSFPRGGSLENTIRREFRGIIKRNLFETSEVIFAWSIFFSFFFWNWNWRETILSFLYTFFLFFWIKVELIIWNNGRKFTGNIFLLINFFWRWKKGLAKLKERATAFHSLQNTIKFGK